jgi:hypothetical protein
MAVLYHVRHFDLPIIPTALLTTVHLFAAIVVGIYDVVECFT